MGAPSLGNTDTVNELVGTHIASLKADDADRHCRVFVCNPRFGHTDTVNERRHLIPHVQNLARAKFWTVNK
jgi:hypothetical protein